MAFFTLVCLIATVAAKLSVPLENLDVRATEQLLRDWNLHEFFGKEVINVPVTIFVTRMPYSPCTWQFRKLKYDGVFLSLLVRIS